MHSIAPFFQSVILAQHAWLLALLGQLWYAWLLHRCRHDWLVQLAHHFDFGPLEQACAAYHHSQGPGAPASHPVPRLVRAMLVKYLFNLSLRATEQRLARDMLVRWFVGYGLFENTPDHTSLERFEQWLNRHQPHLFFDQVLHQIDQRFPHLRQADQLVDSYAMQANAAHQSLISLLRQLARRLLQAVQQADPTVYTQLLSQCDPQALFGPPGELNEYYLSPQQRQERLQQVVTQVLCLGHHLRAWLDQAPSLTSAAHQAISSWLTCLDKVIHDEVRLTFAPEPGADPPLPSRVEELPLDQKGPYCLESAVDLDASCRQHGHKEPPVLAYNVSVLADAHYVRTIRADTGARPDAQVLPELLLEQASRQQLYPARVIGDRAYGAGKTRAAVAAVSQGRTQLVARIVDYQQRSPRFSPDAFHLSSDGATLTCPNGQRSSLAYRSGSGDGRNFRFKASQCQGCPLWSQCRSPQARPGAERNVFISDYRPYIQAAQAYNQTAQFAQAMRLRPTIERIIYNLKELGGTRRARRIGLAQADFQVKMAAAAFNLRQWLRLEQARVYCAPRPTADGEA